MKKISYKIIIIFTSILLNSSCNVFDKEVFIIKDIKFKNVIKLIQEGNYFYEGDNGEPIVDTFYFIPYVVEMEYNGGDLFYLTQNTELQLENINDTKKIYSLWSFTEGGSVLTDINKNELNIDEFKKYKEKKYFIYGLHQVDDYLFKIIDNNTPFDLNGKITIHYGDSKSNKYVYGGSNEYFENQKKFVDEIKNDFINKIKTPKYVYKNIERKDIIIKYFNEHEGLNLNRVIEEYKMKNKEIGIQLRSLKKEREKYFNQK